MKKNKLAETIPFNDTKLNAGPFYNNERFKAVTIAMKSGQILPDHKTAVEALLYCVEGEGLFSMGEESITLSAGEYMTIPAEKIHKLEAVTQSRFILVR